MDVDTPAAEIEPIAPLPPAVQVPDTTEEDQEADALAAEIDNISLTDAERFPFKSMRAKWYKAAQAAYEMRVSSVANESVLMLGYAPRNVEEWNTLGKNLFGEAFVRYVTAGDPTVRHLLPQNAEHPELLLGWIQEHEVSFLKGFRSVDWIDPLYDQNLNLRKVAKPPSACEMGTNYAVCFMFLEEFKDHPTPITIMALNLNSTANGSANHVTRERRDARLREHENLSMEMLVTEERQAGIVREAFQPTVHPRITQPYSASVHGDWLALLWMNVEARVQPEGRRTPVMVDRLELCLLPLCSTNNSVVLEFPHMSVLDYDMRWPYLVLRCSGSRGREVIGAMNTFAWKEDSPPYSCVPDLKEHNTVVLTFQLSNGAPGADLTPPEYGPLINCLGLDPGITIFAAKIAPAMRFPADEAIPESELKLVCELDAVATAKGATLRGSVLCVPLLPTKEDAVASGMSSAVRICENEAEALKIYEATGSKPKTSAVEEPFHLQRYPGGHIVAVTTHNLGIHIEANPPRWPAPHLYTSRDLEGVNEVIDVAIYGNIIITLLRNNVVKFGLIRHANEEDAKGGLKASCTFNLNDLKQQGERSHDIVEEMIYKAIWVTATTVKIMFPDGTVVTLNSMNDTERIKYQEQQKKIAAEVTRRRAMKEESERQMREAKGN